MPNKWLFVTNYLKKQCDKWKCYYTAISQVGVNNCVYFMCMSIYLFIYFLLLLLLLLLYVLT